MTSQREWLEGLDEAALARLLDNRIDVAIDPPPRTYAALAHLLQTPQSVGAAVRSLDHGARSVLAASKDIRTRSELAVRFDEGGQNTAEDIDRALAALVDRALAWPSGDGYRTSALDGLELDGVPSLACPWPGESADVDFAGQQRAIARFCETADAVLDAVDSGSVSTVKAGGVGAREIRTLTTAVDAEHSSVVELVLELGRSMGLLQHGRGVVRSTTDFPAWKASSRAEKLVSMIAGWWCLDGSPTNLSGAKVLSVYPSNASTAMLRHAVLASMPPKGVADDASALRYFEWLLPGFVDAADPGDLEAIWRELSWLGLLAGHAPTELSSALGGLGRCGVGAVETVIAPIVDRIVDGSECVLRLLPDLTAVVTGPVSERISNLLSGAATAESKDAASTWRFSPGSVRRYFDDGGTAENLCAELSEVAVTDIPQSLDYLIKDCARRHGHMVVRSASSVVVSDDESLIREIASLAKLKSRIVAPTVVVSSLPAHLVLDVLREAGHAPTVEGAAA
ncbi:MAG: helicase-associated domain-containing protein, partial [Rhodococcus sp. (in: high G+C Gram-positive bacteria)]